MSELQIFADDFTKAVGQHHAAVLASFFPDPHGTACNVDSLNVQCGQGTSSKAQGARQYNVGYQ